MAVIFQTRLFSSIRGQKALGLLRDLKAGVAASYRNIPERSSPTNSPCVVWRRRRPALVQVRFLCAYSQHLTDSPQYSMGLKLDYKPKTTLVSLIYG